MKYFTRARHSNSSGASLAQSELSTRCGEYHHGRLKSESARCSREREEIVRKFTDESVNSRLLAFCPTECPSSSLENEFPRWTCEPGCSEIYPRNHGRELSVSLEYSISPRNCVHPVDRNIRSYGVQSSCFCQFELIVSPLVASSETRVHGENAVDFPSYTLFFVLACFRGNRLSMFTLRRANFSLGRWRICESSS